MAGGRPGDILPLAGTGLTLRRNGRALIDGLSVELAAAGTVALLGPNGAGKTLLLRLLANLVTPDAGAVTWAGRPPDRARAPRLGFVFQKPVMLRRSVLANMRYVLAAAGLSGKRLDARARWALESAALAHLARAPARLLSGGEQQRLAVARVIATGPEILLLDEPTANLDLAATAMIEAMVRAAAASGTRVVIVSHDVAQARRLADRVMFLSGGRLVESADAATFFAAPRSSAAQDYLAGRIPAAVAALPTA